MVFELKTYLEDLEKNTEEQLALIRSLSEKEKAFRPLNGWSILEVLEHILTTERVVLMMLSRPSANSGSSLSAVGDPYLQAFMKDRINRKFKAPEGLEPKGRLKDFDQFQSSFTEQRNKLRDQLTSGSLKVDERYFKHLILGEMSVSDWLFFIIRHNQRHIDQIVEIRSGIAD